MDVDPGRFPIRGRIVSLFAFQEEDVTPQYLGWLNDPELVRFSNQRFQSHTSESCVAYLHSMRAAGNLFLMIRQGNSCLGTINAYVSQHHRTADMGLLVGAKDRHGSGIGTDAWLTLMTFLLEERKVRKVCGGTLRTNTPMLRIMEKTGMTSDGIRAGHELVDGRPTDVLHFAKFAET